MVKMVESDPDISTQRYLCEKCGSTYVHKGDAIDCENSCTLEEASFDALGDAEDPDTSWTDIPLDDLD